MTATNGRDPALVRRVRRVGTPAQNGHVRLDHNDYGVVVAAARATFRDGSTTYAGLAAWRRGTGQDRRSTITRR